MYLILANQGFTLLRDASGAKCKKCQFKLKREGRKESRSQKELSCLSQNQLNILSLNSSCLV